MSVLQVYWQLGTGSLPNWTPKCNHHGLLRMPAALASCHILITLRDIIWISNVLRVSMISHEKKLNALLRMSNKRCCTCISKLIPTWPGNHTLVPILYYVTICVYCCTYLCVLIKTVIYYFIISVAKATVATFHIAQNIILYLL